VLDKLVMRGIYRTFTTIAVASCLLSFQFSESLGFQGALVPEAKRCTRPGLIKKESGVNYKCLRYRSKLVWRPIGSSSPPVVTSTPSKEAPVTTSSVLVTTSPVSALTDLSLLSNLNLCRLRTSGSDSDGGLIRSGFPRAADAYIPPGEVVVQVIPVDFPNLSGTMSPIERLKPIAEGVSDYYAKVSGGRLNFVWRLPSLTIRMPKPIEDYRLWEPRNNGYAYIQSVLDAADPAIDFTGAHFVLVLHPENADYSQLVFGGPAQQMTRQYKFRTNEGEIFRSTFVGSSFGRDFSKKWIIIAHEFGHGLGLPDLYPYQRIGQNFMGDIDLMASSSSWSALELTAWSKWELSFLPDNQVACNSAVFPSRTWLSPVSSASGRTEMLVLPESEKRAIVIESRRAERFDAGVLNGLWRGGLLVYVVDTSISGGEGPLRIIPKRDSIRLDYFDALLEVGETLQVGSFTIRNIESGRWGDVVEVSRNP
jgi:M6 family metalloprotease-like protein